MLTRMENGCMAHTCWYNYFGKLPISFKVKHIPVFRLSNPIPRGLSNRNENMFMIQCIQEHSYQLHSQLHKNRNNL